MFNIPYQPADIVTCFDVLEHIEPDNLISVLTDIRKHTKKFFFCIIDLLPARKNLNDGRNAHIMLAPPGWWLNILLENFKSGHYYLYEEGLLNKKLCFLGVKDMKYSKISSKLFAATFF